MLRLMCRKSQFFLLTMHANPEYSLQYLIYSIYVQFVKLQYLKDLLNFRYSYTSLA